MPEEMKSIEQIKNKANGIPSEGDALRALGATGSLAALAEGLSMSAKSGSFLNVIMEGVDNDISSVKELRDLFASEVDFLAEEIKNIQKMKKSGTTDFRDPLIPEYIERINESQDFVNIVDKAMKDKKMGRLLKGAGGLGLLLSLTDVANAAPEPVGELEGGLDEGLRKAVESPVDGPAGGRLTMEQLRRIADLKQDQK